MAVAVIAILMLFLLIMVMPKQRLIQTLTDKLNSVTRESLTGIRVVRAYTPRVIKRISLKRPILI